MIDTTLIHNALKLTGKTMEDMFTIDACLYDGTPLNLFSIEKFCYYLLSPEFLKAYTKKCSPYYAGLTYTKFFAEAIYEYQSGNEQPLIDLLKKL